MTSMIIEALRAVKFVGDTVTETEGGKLLPAYLENHAALCRVFNYFAETGVPILAITAGRIDQFLVIEGKYKSALWVWYWFCLNGGQSSVTSDGRGIRISFKMNPAARASAKQYFGEETCRDAKENKETVHTFVREILYTGDVEVSFELNVVR
jgi:hypothetical protein